MLELRHVTCVGTLALLVPALTVAQITTAPPSATSIAFPTNGDQPDTEEMAQQQALSHATDLIKAGKFEAAIRGPIADVIAHYDARYGKDTKTRFYSTRSPQEALLYLASAAKDNQDAKALGPAWGDAYFLKGNALNSLGDHDEAREALQRAVGLAPWNSAYLIELAFAQSKLHNSEKALELCETAEAMTSMSPDDTQLAEKSRALRCQGFNLTELHRYDEAIKKYEAALKLDPNDSISKGELEYINQRRAQSGGRL